MPPRPAAPSAGARGRCPPIPRRLRVTPPCEGAWVRLPGPGHDVDGDGDDRPAPRSTGGLGTRRPQERSASGPARRPRALRSGRVPALRASPGAGRPARARDGQRDLLRRARLPVRGMRPAAGGAGEPGLRRAQCVQHAGSLRELHPAAAAFDGRQDRHVEQRAQLRAVGAGVGGRLLHRRQRRSARPGVLPQRLMDRRRLQRGHADHARRGQLRRRQRLVPRRPLPSGPRQGLAQQVREERCPRRRHVPEPLEQPPRHLVVRSGARLHRRHPDRLHAGRAAVLACHRRVTPARRHPRRGVLLRRHLAEGPDER